MSRRIGEDSRPAETSEETKDSVLLKAKLQLHLPNDKVQQLMAALRETAGEVLEWDKETFYRAEFVLESMALRSSPQVPTGQKLKTRMLHAGNTPPYPFRHIAEDMAAFDTLTGKIIADYLAIKDRRLINIQQYIRTTPGLIKLIVHEDAMANLLRQDDSSRIQDLKHLALQSMDQLFQIPNIRWAVRPANEEKTSQKDAFYRIDDGKVAQFTKRTRQPAVGTSHGHDERSHPKEYLITTGDLAAEGMQYLENEYTQLSEQGRNNDYLKHLLKRSN